MHQSHVLYINILSKNTLLQRECLMSKKSRDMRKISENLLLFIVIISLFIHSRGYANLLTKSWFSGEFPLHYKEHFQDSKIIKIEQDGTPPLVKIHLLTKSGCIYVISPAGRTLSLENVEEVETNSKCLKETKNTE